MISLMRTLIRVTLVLCVIPYRVLSDEEKLISSIDINTVR